MGFFLLLLALGAGLLMVPFGLPGLWLMAVSVCVYVWQLPAGGLGPWTIGVAAGLAFAAEIAEWVVTAQATRRAGGSSRGAWWALAGSLLGAVVGVPFLPLVGSLVGAFLGAFLGAWLAEITLGRSVGHATEAAAGALVGRLMAVGIKVAAGVMIAVWVVAAVVFHTPG